MIAQQDKIELKKAIGFRHITIINKYLIDNKILNRYGFPYSNTYISTVFNGHTDNKDVEDAIWSLANQKLEEQDKEEARRQKVREKLKNLPEDEQ